MKAGSADRESGRIAAQRRPAHGRTRGARERLLTLVPGGARTASRPPSWTPPRPLTGGSPIGLVLVAVLLGGLASSGCPLPPRFGPPPAIGPPAPYRPPAASADTSNASSPLAYSSAADSAAAELNRLVRERYPDGITPTVTIRPPSRPAAQPPVSSPSVNPAPAGSLAANTGGTRATASPDSGRRPETHPPAVAVELPARELSRMAARARFDLAWADSVAQRAALRPLPARDRDKLETALGLIRQGREALHRDDIQAAANLGYKARLLVQEVVP